MLEVAKQGMPLKLLGDNGVDMNCWVEEMWRDCQDPNQVHLKSVTLQDFVSHGGGGHLMVLSKEEFLTLQFWKKKSHQKWFRKLWVGGPGKPKVSVGLSGRWGRVWWALVESQNERESSLICWLNT